MATPRCFIARHGETEWSLSGKHTGTTDIPLTANGEKRVRATGRALVGNDRLIVPKKLKHIYVSPRHRAQRTLELLDIGCHDPFPWQQVQSGDGSTGSKDDHIMHNQSTQSSRKTDARVTVTSAIAEWDYGDYEGITSAEIRAQREKDGLSPNWNIWTDGCPGGESPADIVTRLDALIQEIRDKYHAPALKKTTKQKQDHSSSSSNTKDSSVDPNQQKTDSNEDSDEDEANDVLIVAHGHILRAFAMRWVNEDLNKTALIMDAGGIGTLSYEHHSIHEPAILLGGGFVVGDV